MIGWWCCFPELGFIDLHGVRWNGWFVQPHSPALSTILLLRRLFISASAAFVMTLINSVKQKLCSSCILTHASRWCDISPHGSEWVEDHLWRLISIYLHLRLEHGWWVFRFAVLTWNIGIFIKHLEVIWKTWDFMFHKAFIESQHNHTAISLPKNHIRNVNFCLISFKTHLKDTFVIEAPLMNPLSSENYWSHYFFFCFLVFSPRLWRTMGNWIKDIISDIWGFFLWEKPLLRESGRMMD